MLQILSTIRLEPDLVRRIHEAAGQDTRIAFLSNRPSDLVFPSEREREALQYGNLLEVVRHADVVLGFWGREVQRCLADAGGIAVAAPRLRWVQLTRAGADGIALDALQSGGVVLTTASGMHAVPISEFVALFMLFFAKSAQTFLSAQKERAWQRYSPRELAGQTVGIVGLGKIGLQIARVSKALGCRVVAIRRSEGGQFAEVDELLRPAQLLDLLCISDFVVLSLPLTEDTRNLIGITELRAMKSSAALINIARGQIVVESALVEALTSRTIAGAALDVFEHEPLPSDSPLWDAPNLVLTPHITGGTDRYDARAIEIFSENLQRFRRGERLTNIVKTSQGY